MWRRHSGKMKIILISGKAESGKDASALAMKKVLENKGKDCAIIHYADFLKGFLKNAGLWNGVKDEVGRATLQRFGTEVVRKNKPDTWVNMMVTLLEGVSTAFDVILIPDTRFPNEIEVVKEKFGNNVIALRVKRPGYENHLTQEQRQHISEVILDDYAFDGYINNDGTLNDLDGKVLRVLRDKGVI